MTTATTKLPIPKHSAPRCMTWVLALAIATALLAAPAVRAQLAHTGDALLLASAASLPNAPGLIAVTPIGISSSLESAVPLALGERPQSSATYTTNSPSQIPSTASHTDKYIESGQSVPELSVGNKFALGFKDAFSPFSFAGWAAAAGYEQALNGSPNYGTNSVAFGKRFGASVARAASEGVFSDSVMASVLHEDPRYYRMGPGHNVFRRAGYAATRTLITRTDSGRATPNFALLGGNLGGAYLTKTYYPDLNTSNGEVLKTFAGSIGGSALGFAVSEFFSPLVKRISFHKDRD